MADISKKDLHEFKTDIKTHIDERFNSHEVQERLMLEPLIKRVDTHSTILRGPNGDAGLVKDVNNIKLFKGIAGGGFLAAVAAWIDKIFR